MNIPNLLQYSLFLLIVIALAKPIGSYMARVFEGDRTWLDPLLRPLERRLYQWFGIHPKAEMNARQYTGAFLLFSLIGTLLLYAILRLQSHLPWFYPAYQHTPLTPDLAMNTAVSFMTTTTWQAYAGETTMSYFSQMAGLCAQSFMAGAAGLAVGVAFIRGLARERTTKLGNFWVDMVRALLWILLPIAAVGSLALIWQGVPMNFSPYTKAAGLEGSQVIAQGPVAVFHLIETLGTAGGGFFNANNAHPFGCPTPLANLIEMLAICVVPAAFTYTYGRMTGRIRDGWMLLGVMVTLFSAGVLVSHLAEQSGIPAVRAAHVGTGPIGPQPGGNMEGKEVRFGIGGTVLNAIATSNTSTGSVNAAPDSLTPIGGAVSLVNMFLGEIIFGGLGTGLYSIILVALVGLFLAGLMVGRTPEYLGKSLGVTELKLIMLYTLACPAAVLLLSALAVSVKAGLAGLTTNSGMHGFTEILYAYATCFANNGQSFAGLSANSAFYNITTAITMMVGRFGLAIPALALAGRFAQQGRRPESNGTLPTASLQFALVVIGTALLVTGLSFFPALALGPVVEHFVMSR